MMNLFLQNVVESFMRKNAFSGLLGGPVKKNTLYNVSLIFAKSHEKSHRLWTKNLCLARGLLALQIKIPFGIHFLGAREGGI